MNINYFILDLDDTLSNTHHRSDGFDFDNAGDEEWIKYHKDCAYDTPTDFLHSLKMLLDDGIVRKEELIVMSGRSDIAREETNQWLVEHLGFVPEIVFMRPADCRIKNEVLKLIWAESIGLNRIKAVYDDNKKVVKAFEDKGVKCHLVQSSTYDCNNDVNL